ncbi:MAG: hypothetical protein Q4A27_03155 [bacterium]|nr:hypothetical protein [bacterium]
MEDKKQKVVEIRKGENDKTAQRPQVVVKTAPKVEYSAMVKTVRSVCFWVMILSTVVLASLGVISIWTDISDIFGKAFATFIVVASASGFVALIAPLLDKSSR